MVEHMINIINIAQLEMLGVQKEYLYASMLIICLMIVAIICSLLIKLCIYYQWHYVIIYVCFSLLFLLLIWHPFILAPIDISLGTGLKMIAMIGCCFALYLIVTKKQDNKKGV